MRKWIIGWMQFWLHIMILISSVHRSNGPKPGPNQCMNARFQVAEKNLKIKKKLQHKWPILIASGTLWTFFLQSPN